MSGHHGLAKYLPFLGKSRRPVSIAQLGCILHGLKYPAQPDADPSFARSKSAYPETSDGYRVI
jgi:hypothetical protein